MTSRTSAFAALFAVFATALIALAAATTQVQAQTTGGATPVVVELPTVTVVGKRVPAQR